jgi:hypothetical protein
MVYLIISLLVILLLITTFFLGFLIGDRAVEEKGEQALLSPEEIKFSDATDDPVFSEFLSSHTSIKSALCEGIITQIWMDEQIIELTIANPTRHSTSIVTALEGAEEIRLIYEINNG